MTEYDIIPVAKGWNKVPPFIRKLVLVFRKRIEKLITNILFFVFFFNTDQEAKNDQEIKNKETRRSDYSGVYLMLFGLTASLLSGCASNYAPVEQRGSTPYSVKKKYTGKLPAYHLVKEGDTLYSIAWIYGSDYKDIAGINGIKSPYRIFVGDRLILRSAQDSKSYYAKKTYTKNPKAANYNSRQIKNNKTVANNTGTVSSNTVRNTTSAKTRASVKTKSASNSKRAVNTHNKTATFTGSERLKWIWPVKGTIIQRYSPGSGKKGIDISASKGTLIKSSEAGKVVYSGQGLVGYGRLIIIKHNDTYLSAYAHNQSLLVNEGQLVKKGQDIARLGRSGTDRYKLHFEIRKNGTPVNPISYLPN